MKPSQYENLTVDQINEELQKGGKFVVYIYVISIGIMTFRRPSKNIYFIRHDEFAIKHGWPYLLISLICGWWGIPWGPIYTIGAVFQAFTGKNVTEDVIDHVNSQYDLEEIGETTVSDQ